MEGTVTILKNEYYNLLCAAEELSILEGAGVDNWNGYGEGFEDWDEWKDAERERVEKM